MKNSNKNPFFLGYLIPLVIFLLTAILLYYGLDRDPRYVPSPLINKPIPVLNKKLFLGHVSLLNVWATWCTSCKEEHEVLMSIAKSKKVIIYGLNYKDDKKEALNWLAHKGNPYNKLLFDEQGTVGVELGVYGTPETYLIDGLGVIKYKHIGPITEQVWREIILPEINKIES